MVVVVEKGGAFFFTPHANIRRNLGCGVLPNSTSVLVSNRQSLCLRDNLLYSWRVNSHGGYQRGCLGCRHIYNRKSDAPELHFGYCGIQEDRMCPVLGYLVLFPLTSTRLDTKTVKFSFSSLNLRVSCVVFPRLLTLDVFLFWSSPPKRLFSSVRFLSLWKLTVVKETLWNLRSSILNNSPGFSLSDHKQPVAKFD